MNRIGKYRYPLSGTSQSFQSRAVILIYHRVAELSTDPQLLSITPENFKRHLEHIRRNYQPMKLGDFILAFVENRVPENAVVITFDDGYVDNLWYAKPLLERYEIPATVFITTGYVGQDLEFWWDELERIVLLPEQLPERLSISIAGKRYEWELGAINVRPTRHWDVTMGFYPDQRSKAYCELHRLLRPLSFELQQEALTSLAQLVGVSRNARDVCRVLNMDEIRMIGGGGIVELGAHSITHPVLAKQPMSIQKNEIIGSKRYLENVLGSTICSFSYPFGGASDVGRYALRKVHKAGYHAACSNSISSITSCLDPYWLPRFLVRDWDGERFEAQLRGWFGA